MIIGHRASSRALRASSNPTRHERFDSVDQNKKRPSGRFLVMERVMGTAPGR